MKQKNLFLFLVLLCFSQTPLFSQTDILFDDYFLDATMRVDYFQTGDDQKLFFSIDQIYKQKG